jgi:hypothetical protein
LKVRLNKILYFYLAFLLGGMLPPCLMAQNHEIEQVLPYLSQDSLKVDITVRGFLEDQILKTLLAGLPLNIGVELRLIDQNQKEVLKNQYLGKINYDVWEERFRVIDFSGVARDFELLEEVKTWSRNIKQLALMPQSKIDVAASYQVIAKLEVLLITRKQNQQLKWWLGKSDPTEEEIASEERSTGFRLNLNQLVQIFFSSDQEPEKYSVTKISDVFRLSDLKFQ